MVALYLSPRHGHCGSHRIHGGAAVHTRCEKGALHEVDYA
jgi:hypothetical protein